MICGKVQIVAYLRPLTKNRAAPMRETWERFPTDEMNLTLLEAACNINEDTGHTELQRFLSMTGGPITSVTMNGILYDSVDEALADVDDNYGPPMLEIECAPGDEPHSEHTVILSLIEEVRRQRYVVEAARRYRLIGLADPTSLDLPPAGSDLDKALAKWEAHNTGTKRDAD